MGIPIWLLAIIVLFFLCKTQVGLYYFRLSVYYTYLTIFGLLTILPASFKPKNVSNMIYPASLAHFLLKYVLCHGPRVKGREHIPDGPCVLMVNHQSSLDLAMCIAPMIPRMTVLAKREIMYMGPFGFAAWLCGIVFIDRLSPDKARKTMDFVVKRIKDEDIRLLVFPEGTRNRDGDLLPFKKGGFHVAQQAQVPIVPMVISPYDSFYSQKKRKWESGDVCVEFFPPIPTVGMSPDDVTKLTNDTRSVIYEGLAKVRKSL